MLTRKIIYLGAFLMIFCKTHAQVNLQTGSATFSLPMFNWQDDKSRLTSVVALSYNSGNGLKVNDVASNVGQGWNLIAGGVITRLQVGDPDDQTVGVLDGPTTEHDINKYPPGYLTATKNAFTGCPKSLLKYPIYGTRNIVYTQHNATTEDKQLDYFVFQFNGKTGMFILDKYAIGGTKAVMLGYSTMKITFTTGTIPGARTTITSFTIQDGDGLIYVFDKLGLTEVLEEGFCDATLVNRLATPSLKALEVRYKNGFENPSYINPWVVSNWYLSQIKDPLVPSRVITFNYTTPPATGSSNYAGATVSYNDWHNWAIITHKKSVTKTMDPLSITYPDGHSVIFNYNATDRVDLVGSKALTSVDIKYSGRFLSKYLINTSYFILDRYGTPITPYQRSVARLCLRSVQKISVDLKEDTPPYLFDYNLVSKTTGTIDPDDYVPPPFHWQKDPWGYYNGLNTTVFTSTTTPVPSTRKITDFNDLNELKGMCFMVSGSSTINLNAKDGYAKNGLLRQIIYPTGGTLTYEYVQNRGTLPQGVESVIGGVHVSKTSSTDGGYSNGCGNPLVTQYDYVIDSAGLPSSLWGLETPVNTMTEYTSYAPEQKKKHWNLSNCITGCCVYNYMYPGILSQTDVVTIEGVQKIMNFLGPALGILSVVTSVADMITLACGPSGIASWVAVVADILASVLTQILTCATDYSKAGTSNFFYNTNLNEASPLPTQFKRVEVTESPGAIGKTVYTFTSPDYYPDGIWIPTGSDLQKHFAAGQRFAAWAYGLPLITTVYDHLGNKVRETENTYRTYQSKFLIEDYGKTGGDPQNMSGIFSPLVSCRCGVISSSSQNDPDWANVINYDPDITLRQTSSDPSMQVDFCGYNTGWFPLERTYERVFGSSDHSQKVETETDYDYASNFEVKQITVTQSNGDVVTKNITYPLDYPSAGGIFNTLLQNNIVNLPISTNTTVYNSALGYQTLNEKVTEFAQLPNGDVKPSRTLEQRFNKPDVGTVLYSPTNPNNSTIYKVTQTFNYDASNNLTGLKDEGMRSVANIYCYNDKFITASVINADAVLDHCAYSSFESDAIDFAKSGWTLNGATFTYTPGTNVTGTGYYALAPSKSFSATLNTAKAYILSFWASAGLTVTGGTQTKSGPTNGPYTYYEYNIAQGTTSVSVSGTGNIDELRLYPKNARMRTTTYDPLLGKTSECDENNRISYYEYDNLGRLQFLKDENRNIVKMYEYNNVSAAKQNGCPTTYYNKAITEYFTRSCSAGSLGSDVPVTVAANTYSSAISQADADAKAELYLLTNGQNTANTSGSCTPIICNVVNSVTYISEGCALNEDGGSVTYTVPAGRYCSIVPGVADAMAQTDQDANGIAYANSPAHRVCQASTAAKWETPDMNPQLRCQHDANNNLTGNQEALATDVNPSSPTYNQTQWMFWGPNEAACPHQAGSAPVLVTGGGQQSVNGSGVITGTPGTVIHITIQLNSSSSTAHLTGNVGGSVDLSGTGTPSVVNTVTIPATGYISWNLNLQGNPGSFYITSSITVN